MTTPPLPPPTVAVLLDCSHSVISNHNSLGQPVWQVLVDKLVERLQELNVQEVYLTGWNVHDYTMGPFFKGVYQYDTPVPTTFLRSTLGILCHSINGSACTETSLGFRNIHPSFFNQTRNSVVILATDGQMGWRRISEQDLCQLRADLVAAVRALPPEVNVEILCVEPQAKDYSLLEESKQAAGIDVYDALSAADATEQVVSVVSYSGDCRHKFSHLSRTRAPPGHVSFRGAVCSKRELFQLRRTVMRQAVLACSSDEELARAVQDVGEVLRQLGAAATPAVVDLFAELFRGHEQHVFIKWTLEQSAQQRAAPIYSRVKHGLFKDALRALQLSVRNSLPPSDLICSFLQEDALGVGRVFFGPRHLMTEQLHNHPDAGTSGVATFSAVEHPSPLAGQCLRLWARTVLSKSLGVGVRSNRLIFYALEQAARVCVSSAPQEVKHCFSALARCMLSKNCGDGPSLYEQLCAGEPVASDDWGRSMVLTAARLGVAASPQQVWWWLLQQLNDPALLEGQRLHCLPLVQLRPVLPTLLCEPFPPKLRYFCPVELEDTSASGGYVAKQHGACRLADVLCYPLAACYVCGEECGWTLVPPEGGVGGEGEGERDGGKGGKVEKKEGGKGQEGEEEKVGNGPRYVIHLRGAVGAGKTSVAELLTELARAEGVEAVRVGMDQYAAQGFVPKQVQELVQAQVAQCAGLVVVDTCRSLKLSNVFGYELSPRTTVLEFSPAFERRNWEAYLAWATLNVLNRKGLGSAATFFLCPDSSGVDACLRVAERKAQLIVGRSQACEFFRKLHAAPDPLQFLAQAKGAWQPVAARKQAEECWMRLKVKASKW